MLLKLRTSNSPNFFLQNIPITILNNEFKWQTKTIDKNGVMLVIEHKALLKFNEDPPIYDMCYVLYNGQTFYIKREWCEQI